MAPPAVIRVAAAAYQVEPLADWAALETKLSAWVAEAARSGAQIAVFPEYAGVEGALVGGAAPLDWCDACAEVAAQHVDVMRGLATAHGLWVLSGSLPTRVGGLMLNRAHLIAPDGQTYAVDKHRLTPWERANTPLVPGDTLTCVDTDLGRIGVLICYDSEFPTLARALDADIQLIPACTDTEAGQSRVQIAARARALEGQCVTVHAPLVGDVPNCDLIDTNVGTAGVFAPPDKGLPSDGWLGVGQPNKPMWTFADVSLATMKELRATGHTQIRKDWPSTAPVNVLSWTCNA